VADWENAPDGWEDAPARRSIPKVIDYHPTVGLGETALTIGSGMAAQVAAGLAGLGQAATNAVGLTDTPAGDRVRRVSEAMTYQPRTAAGQKITEAVSLPFELLAKGADAAGGAVTDLTGSPAAGAAVNTGINSLPLMAGPVSRAVPGESAASIAARARQATAAEKMNAEVAAAREAGLVVPPSQANGGLTSRVVEGLSGEPKLSKLASKKNAPVINDMVKRDVGLPDDVPLSREALADVRKEAGKAYELVKSAGQVTTDAKYRADLDAIVKAYDTAAKDFSHRSENPFKKTLDGLRTNGFDAASGIEEVKLLRADADKAYRQGDKGLGRAFRDAAQAVDDQLDRHLNELSKVDNGNPDLARAVAEYRKARVVIAKTYLADKALNDSTGNINAIAYAKAKARDAKLTGEAKQVADFATAFPRSAQRVERIGSTGPSYMDVLLPLISKEAMLLGARPLAREALLSGPVQDSIMAPRTFGPSIPRRLQDLLDQRRTEAGLAGVAGMSAGNRQ
jgi:hypothetical protein